MATRWGHYGFRATRKRWGDSFGNAKRFRFGGRRGGKRHGKSMDFRTGAHLKASEKMHQGQSIVQQVTHILTPNTGGTTGYGVNDQTGAVVFNYEWNLGQISASENISNFFQMFKVWKAQTYAKLIPEARSSGS